MFTLEKAEESIKEQNELFLNEDSEWFSKLNEFSDLPKDEFKEEKTGLENGTIYARGLLTPETIPVDEESERFFQEIDLSRNDIPSSYSSLDKELVSEVKNQLQCGSCVAFSTVAAIETCFKKLTGVFGDYSEQQLVDCGIGQIGGNGCDGAGLTSYLRLWPAPDLSSTAGEESAPSATPGPRTTPSRWSATGPRTRARTSG